MKHLQRYTLHIILTLLVCGAAMLNCPLRALESEPYKADTLTMMVEPMTIVFSGDVMQHLPQVLASVVDGSRISVRRDSLGVAKAVRCEGNDSSVFDYSPSFKSIAALWKSADFAVVNFETTISPDGLYTGYPMFGSPAVLAKFLADAGVKVAALANNHIVDRGARGLRGTVATLARNGIRTMGAYPDSVSGGKILYVEKEGYKVALLNYTYGTNGISVPRDVRVNKIDTVFIKRQIQQARGELATHIIAFFHWGQEYMRKPDKGQKEMAAWARRSGVDVVVGSHPHVVQRVDTVMRVAYSLGNFVSNQSDRHTDYGISLRVTLDKKSESVKLEAIPHWVDRANRYRILLPSDTIDNKSAKFRTALIDGLKIMECQQIKNYD